MANRRMSLGRELLGVHRQLRARLSAIERAPEVEREVAGISAVLANHLAYEERVLVSVLDGLEVGDDSLEAQALRAPLDGIFEPAES